MDDDFRASKVADEWFRYKYNMRLLQKDMESTNKYRFDEKVGTGGTFRVNYATMGGRILALNYRTIFYKEEKRSVLLGHITINIKFSEYRSVWELCYYGASDIKTISTSFWRK